jgi:transposase
VPLDALAVRNRREEKVIDAVSVRRKATELGARLDGLLARPAIRHHENRKLLAHLRRERAHLFTFVSEPGIPATKWRGEQALRPAVVNRKVWGGNRDLSGARTQEMVGSVVRTCRQQARDPHAVITALLGSPVPMVATLLAPTPP